jgi:hypothetical protein
LQINAVGVGYLKAVAGFSQVQYGRQRAIDRLFDDLPTGHFASGNETKPVNPNPRLPASAFSFIVTAAK